MFQVCEKEKSKTWQKVWLEAEKAWYMTSGDQWITYENVDSAILKVGQQAAMLVDTKRGCVLRLNMRKPKN